MRVLMVSANTEQLNMPVLPVGMACVAAAIEHAGHEIRVVNLMRPEHVEKSLAPAIAEFAPDVIGISVRNIDDQNMQAPNFLLSQVKPVIAECRSLADAPIVLGGPGYSIFPESALAYLGADYGIQGEGEWAMIELLARLEKNASLAGLNGLWIPGTGLMAPPFRNRDLDAYPMPLPGRHLDLPPDVDSRELMVPFQTRRGCPMNCSYCSTPAIEGRHMRRHAPETAADNLKRFVEAGYKRFFFVDNTFNLPPSYAKTLCDQIVAAGLDIAWQGIVYPTRIDEALVEKMAQSGCRGASVGFESASDCVLSAMNKKYGKDEIRRLSEMLYRHGIDRMGFLLLGGPGETRETVLESIAFAERLELESVKLTAGIRIYPSTPLAETARQKGVVDPGASLLEPAFYVEPGLEGWLQGTIADAIARNPGWMT
ncbi:MAG: B12-binding domain-containing radical SAM protein [Thermodesulfobacteriota bacterium]